jgi:hypothetical protein
MPAGSGIERQLPSAFSGRLSRTSVYPKTACYQRCYIRITLRQSCNSVSLLNRYGCQSSSNTVSRTRHGNSRQDCPVERKFRAVQTPDVDTDSTICSDANGHGGNGKGNFGLSTRDLQRLAEVPAQAVFSPQTGIISSASQLAQLLNSSLTTGVTADESDLASRRAVLGSNSIPERAQVMSQRPVTTLRNEFVEVQ